MLKLNQTTDQAVADLSVALPATKGDFTLSVIMPVYNEARTLMEIIKRVREIEINKEIIIVDDGSTDGTIEILREQVEDQFPDVKVFYHEKNRGKGAAIRTAVEKSTGDYIIIQDADLEYNPKEYFSLLAPILDGRADVVYGSRFLGGGGPRRVHLFWHSIANLFLTTLSNMMTNLNLTDMEVCYKVFKADILKGIKLRSNRFEFEPEITAKIAKMRCRIYEVPISYSGRDYEEGKKIGWKDGVTALWSIFRFRFFD